MSIATKSNPGRFVFFIFLAAFLVRMIYVFQVLQFPLTEYFVTSDTFDQYGFDNRALFIASGNWLGGSEALVKEPLYSYFLAAIYMIFGYSHFAVYLIQSLLTSIGAILIYKISTQLFNRFAGYIAAFIMAFYSMSIFYDALLLRASLVTFLILLLFYLLLKAHRDNSTFMWLISGATLGLCMLTRLNILLPFILLFILFNFRPLKIAIKAALIFIVGMFIVLLPVLARNYITSDYKKIAISSEMNAFWVGNTRNASGIDFEPADPGYCDLEFRSGESIKKTAHLFFNEIKKRPREYLRLYIRKAWMFFNGYEAPSNTNYYLYREEFPTILRWPIFSFRFICCLGVSGLLLSLFAHKRPYLVYIFFIVLGGSVILFHVLSRYRMPVAPFFIIFSSYAIHFIFDKMRHRAFMKAIVIVAASICLYMVLKPDLTYAGFRPRGEKIRSIDRTNLALAYIDNYKIHREEKDLEAALRQCNLAIEKESPSYIPYAVKAQVYFLENRFIDSVNEYKKALVYDNRNPFLYNEIAGVYYTQTSYERALVYIKRALHLFPGNKLFKKNLEMIQI